MNFKYYKYKFMISVNMMAIKNIDCRCTLDVARALHGIKTHSNQSVIRFIQSNLSMQGSRLDWKPE